MIEHIVDGNLLPHRPLTDNELNVEDKTIRQDDYAVPGIHKWWSCDTEHRYKQNLDRQSKDWHYRNTDVSYDVNSSGYRCPEFDTIDWENSAVIFGCSETFGTGLAQQETISHQLSEILQMPVINLGKNGTSMEYALANNLILRNHYPTPKLVINHWTELMRSTYFGKDKIVTTLPRHEVYYQRHINMLIKLLGFDVDDATYTFDVKAKMISDICKIFWSNTKYVELSWNAHTAHILGCHKRIKVDTARDICPFDQGHSGKDTALDVAKFIAEKYNEA